MTVIKKVFAPNLYETTWLVDKKHHGLRLDQFVQMRLKGFSREQIKKKISTDEIKIIDRPFKAFPKTKVYEGDRVLLKIHNTTHEDEWWNGKKLELELVPTIVYEDGQLIGISKPPYMSVHPTGKHLFNCATVYFENISHQNVYSIHRLDRETSGILLLAKNSQTASTLTRHFEKNNIKKCYFFISVINEQYNGKNEFSVQNRIAPSERFGFRRVIMKMFSPDSSNGKSALTHFKILKQKNCYILGLAFPLTGRQHQIRIHAMSQGLPLLGDKLYYGSFEMFQRFKDNKATPDDHKIMEIPRHALHALAINFPYPAQRKTLLSPLPKDLQEWLSKKFEINLEQLQSQLREEVTHYFNTVDK